MSGHGRASGSGLTTVSPAARRVALSVLVLVGVVLALVLSEVVLRGMARQAGATRTHRYMMSDPVLHHRARPSLATQVSGVEFRTNSLGLRDREYASPKPPGIVRLLMLGDSFTEGGGLPIEQTVAKRVEAGLNARGCGGYEVVNAGAASYSPILEYLLLERLLPRLEPDLVVLNFDMTDVHDDLIRTATAILDARGLPVAVPSDPIREGALLLPPPPRWLGRLGVRLNGLVLYQMFRRSAVGQWLLGPARTSPEQLEAHGLVGDPQRDPLAIMRDVDSPALERAWAVTQGYLVAARDLARARGATFVLVAYPHSQQVSAAESPVGRRQLGAGPGLYASERPFARLEALGRREGFPVINLVALFRARTAEGPLFRRDDMHHTPAGAAVFAEGVLSGLLSAGALPACAR